MLSVTMLRPQMLSERNEIRGLAPKYKLRIRVRVLFEDDDRLFQTSDCSKGVFGCTKKTVSTEMTNRVLNVASCILGQFEFSQIHILYIQVGS